MQIKTIRVYPVPGRIVRHPETGEIVPPEGWEVPRAGYWLRRLLAGDVSEAPVAAPSSRKSSVNTKAEEGQS